MRPLSLSGESATASHDLIVRFSVFATCCGENQETATSRRAEYDNLARTP
jgi:hypothetical protein